MKQTIEYSLLQVGQFPLETRFQLLYEIDQCFLFFVGKRDLSDLGDPFSAKFFHVALWHEDVIDLLKAGDVRGIDLVSMRERAEQRAAELRDMYYEMPEGELAPVAIRKCSVVDQGGRTCP